MVEATSRDSLYPTVIAMGVSFAEFSGDAIFGAFRLHAAKIQIAANTNAKAARLKNSLDIAY